MTRTDMATDRAGAGEMGAGAETGTVQLLCFQHVGAGGAAGMGDDVHQEFGSQTAGRAHRGARCGKDRRAGAAVRKVGQIIVMGDQCDVFAQAQTQLISSAAHPEVHGCAQGP